MLEECVGDLVLGEMDRRRDDVAGRLVAELDDVLAQIGLDRRDAGLLEMLVERDLLGHHRLRLGDGACTHALAEIGDDASRIGGGRCPMNVAAQADHLALELLEVEIEIGERVVLDVARTVAQRLEFRQALGCLAPALGEADLEHGQRVLEVGIRQRAVDVALEVVGGGFHQRFTASGSPPSGSPIAAIEPMSASTSATCRTCTVLPSRCSLPAMFIRQPRSPANKVPAPVAAISADFSPTMAFDISGYFTQKVPPKPQQTSGVFISLMRSPSTDPSSWRGCAFTPSSRRPEQES